MDNMDQKFPSPGENQEAAPELVKEELDPRETSSQEREGVIFERETRADRQEENIEAEYQKRRSELDTLEAELKSKQAKLKAFEAELKNKQAELDSEKLVLEKRQMEIEENKRRANSLMAQADLMKESIRKDREEVSTKALNIAEKEAELDSLLEKKRTDEEKRLQEERARAAEEIGQSKLKSMQDIAEKQKNSFLEIEKKAEIMQTEFENELSKERTKLHQEFISSLNKERQSQLEAIKAQRDALAKERDEFENVKASVADQKALYERNNRIYKQREQKLTDRENMIEEEVADRMEERENALNRQIANITEQRNDTFAENTELKKQLESYKMLSAMCENNPEKLQKELSDLKEQIVKLKDEKANAPSQQVVIENGCLKKENEELNTRCGELITENCSLKQEIQENDILKYNLDREKQKTENLEFEIQTLTNEKEQLRTRIERMCAAESKAAERTDRISALFDLNAPKSILRNEYNKGSEGTLLPQPTDEIKWLADISKHCDEYGISFPKRILYAFHTALKISDWSTVTVLAGVSGTGKSELPRLYSAFGGINFISVPVQPNWDSQEAMLGYFNSIDNRFDAQPLLRFLVQSTENFTNSKDADLQTLKEKLTAGGFEPHSEYMNLVLLDEMNLAHVELYFADFLSKLETRRGKAKTMVPTIEVKLGAGIEPYNLKLSRNVLWAGTMNQDETTKSLSDKVLDRGVVINFPRPKELKDRTELISLDKMQKSANIPMLKHSTWDDNWVVKKDTFAEEQMVELDKCKRLVEAINNDLGAVGRALGHRVWQSIKFYIINYPDVIAAQKNAQGGLDQPLKTAIHTAFEDQIVQKIMPKLRGIETKGRSKTECLDRIRSRLDDEYFGFNLTDDFDLACNLGYGQFIWSSANYINTEESATVNKTDLQNN